MPSGDHVAAVRELTAGGQSSKDSGGIRVGQLRDDGSCAEEQRCENG